MERQSPASRRGATIDWLRLYRAADGPLYAMLFTAYVFVTAIPAAVVLATYIYGDPARLADRLSNRLHLDGSTAALLHGVLVGATSHQFVSTAIAAANVVVFGSGFGRTLQLAHARAWRIDVSASRLGDHERYLAVLAALVALLILYLEQTAIVSDGSALGLLTVPLWVLALVVYFAWAPRLLLHGRVRVTDVLPGAAFVAACLIALRLASRVVLARWLTWYSASYGGFGIVLALFFWLLVLGGVVVVGASLSPPLAARRTLLASDRRLAQEGRSRGRAVPGRGAARGAPSSDSGDARARGE